uniref:50S ribosomal protein L19-1, chloroplastic n=1 Tax=Anthurium amnicola TaxID=1678845 RepID=A0A1D1XKV8_9ARAE
MGSWVLPSHALPCHPTALPSPAPHPRLALSVSPRPSLVPKRLPFAWAAASCTPTAARRNGTLAVVQAAEGDAVVEVAEALGDEPEEEETDGVSEDEELPRKPIVKLGDIMGILHTRAIEASEKERPVPDLRTGDIIQIKLEVPENRRRVSIYKGIVMSKQNAGIPLTSRRLKLLNTGKFGGQGCTICETSSPGFPLSTEIHIGGSWNL